MRQAVGLEAARAALMTVGGADVIEGASEVEAHA